MMLAIGSITSAASTRSASSCALATAKFALMTVMSLPSSMPLALAYILMTWNCEPPMSAASCLPFRSASELIFGSLANTTRSDEREAGAENAQRHAFLIELLQDRRSADQHVGLAGRERGIERRDRRIGLGVQLEAVLGVEAARLHDVPDQRVEHRQRQTRGGDLRPLLRIDAVVPMNASALAVASIAKPRRENMIMKPLPLVCWAGDWLRS